MEILRVVLDVIEGDTIKLVSIARVNDSIDPSTQSETAQAQTETVTHSSYGECVKLDRNSPEFAARKEELKKLGYKWDRKEKGMAKVHHRQRFQHVGTIGTSRLVRRRDSNQVG